MLKGAEITTSVDRCPCREKTVLQKDMGNAHNSVSARDKHQYNALPQLDSRRRRPGMLWQRTCHQYCTLIVMLHPYNTAMEGCPSLSTMQSYSLLQ